MCQGYVYDTAHVRQELVDLLTESYNPNLTRQQISAAARYWAADAQLGHQPTELTCCQQPIHVGCLAALQRKSFQAPTPLDFVALPLEPDFYCGEFECPVCRSQTQSQQSGGYRDAHGWGPYALHAGAVVWYYKDAYEPGHAEGGNLGRLVKLGPVVNHPKGPRHPLQMLEVEPLLPEPTENETHTVPACSVFDVAFLHTTGIPTRAQVNFVLAQYGQPLLVTEESSLDEACMLADSVGESYLEDRRQRLVRLKNTRVAWQEFRDRLRPLLKAHLMNTVSELLHPVAQESEAEHQAAYLLTSKIVPRLGVLSKSTHQSLPQVLAFRALLEPEAVRALTQHLVDTDHLVNQETVQTVLRYASTGRLANRADAVGVLKAARRACETWKHNPIPAVSDLASFHDPIPTWANEVQLETAYETKRVKTWVERYVVIPDPVVQDKNLYFVIPTQRLEVDDKTLAFAVHPQAPLAERAAVLQHFGEPALLSKHTLSLPLDVDVKDPFPTVGFRFDVTRLAEICQACPVVRRAVLERRQQCVPVRFDAQRQIAKQQQVTALDKYRQEFKRQTGRDLLRIPWASLSWDTRQFVLGTLRQVYAE